MGEDSAIFWKGSFLLSGIVSTVIGLIQESSVRTYGGIALILIAFLVAVK